MARYLYNGVDPFAGLCEPPIYSKSEELVALGYDEGPEDYARKTTIILSGQLRADSTCAGLQSSYNLTKSLILNFAENFKNFIIFDNISAVFSGSAFVESIEFPESLFIGLIPFQIRLSFLTTSYPVLDQKEEFIYEEQEGCLVSVTHNVSCRGFAGFGITDPMTYAKLFISGRMGYIGFLDPYGYSVTSPVLRSRNQTVNELTAEVSLTEVYSFDKSNTSGDRDFVCEYTTTVSEKDAAAEISANGKIYGAINGDIALTRAHFVSMDFYTICLNTFQESFNTTEILETIPFSISATEDRDDNSISFSVVYRNKAQNDPFLIPSFTFSDNRDGTVCFSADITIRSLFGTSAERLAKTLNKYQTTDWFSYINSKLVSYGYSATLSDSFKSKTYSIDNESGDISFSVTYCTDSEKYFDNFRYSMSFSPPIPQFSESATVDGEGCYYVQDLGFLSRGKFSINGTATPSKCISIEETKSKIVTEANRIMIEYFDATDIILDAENIEISDDKTAVSFSFSWNGIQAQGLNDSYILGTF